MPCHEATCKVKHAVFNLPGQTKGIYCNEHKQDGMQDVQNKYCLLCPVRAGQRYKGYCYRCFIYMFPDSSILRNHKTKERHVADFLRAEFPEYTLVLDQRVNGGCSNRRPDVLLDMGEYVIIIEIDENQHQDYDCTCENKRLMELFQDCGGRPMAMIRFNPDKYYNASGHSVPSCWGNNGKGLCVVKEKCKTDWAKRLVNISIS